MRSGGWYATDEKCPEWPCCTGHPGPTPEEREAERRDAELRVRIKRAIRMAIRGWS